MTLYPYWHYVEAYRAAVEAGDVPGDVSRDEWVAERWDADTGYKPGTALAAKLIPYLHEQDPLLWYAVHRGHSIAALRRD